MDINNWLKKSGSAPTVYYGYALPGTTGSTNKWMIMKETGDPADTREWADNDYNFDKIWDDRAAYFVAPSVAPTLVSSGVTSTNIQATWDYVAGMTKYFVSVFENNRELMGWNNNRIHLTPNNQIVINVPKMRPGGTYRVVLTGKNGFGSISTEFSVTMNS